MKIFKSVEDYQNWRKALSSDQKIGFVPTMGALHSGHAELMKQSRLQNLLTVVSIYVNPTQFNNSEDLEKYPRTLEQDLRVCNEQGVEAVLLPTYEQIYSDGYRYKVVEQSESLLMDGAHRPGHFDGVLSVVLKLFMIVRPQKAFFGEKDFQQLKLIQGMTQAFFLDIEIVPVKTVREEDGLAKSSRNVRLTESERKVAPSIYRSLIQAKTCKEAADLISQNGMKVDYVEEHWGRRFVAAHLGNVRLIDNVEQRGGA